MAFKCIDIRKLSYNCEPANPGTRGKHVIPRSRKSHILSNSQYLSHWHCLHNGNVGKSKSPVECIPQGFTLALSERQLSGIGNVWSLMTEELACRQGAAVISHHSSVPLLYRTRSLDTVYWVKRSKSVSYLCNAIKCENRTGEWILYGFIMLCTSILLKTSSKTYKPCKN